MVENQQLSRQALGHGRSGGGDAARGTKVRRVFDRQVHLLDAAMASLSFRSSSRPGLWPTSLAFSKSHYAASAVKPRFDASGPSWHHECRP